jgi:hypothetical protein
VSPHRHFTLGPTSRVRRSRAVDACAGPNSRLDKPPKQTCKERKRCRSTASAVDVSHEIDERAHARVPEAHDRLALAGIERLPFQMWGCVVQARQLVSTPRSRDTSDGIAIIEAGYDSARIGRRIDIQRRITGTAARRPGREQGIGVALVNSSRLDPVDARQW